MRHVCCCCVALVVSSAILVALLLTLGSDQASMPQAETTPTQPQGDASVRGPRPTDDDATQRAEAEWQAQLAQLEQNLDAFELPPEALTAEMVEQINEVHTRCRSPSDSL